MKKAEDLKKGDICYLFNLYGDFKGSIEIKNSISKKTDEHLGSEVMFKTEDYDICVCYGNKTYGDLVSYPHNLLFFSKEGAIDFFNQKINRIREGLDKLR